ncbi:MAG: zinc transporter ZupT [Defluviitaleaceae bacterium]|nr:zinc transporter ZupT [Defluviitaleaceae bacterium]MCL2262284.1 zinc transporter ZupT [Defluviitaleaceae bacterium]
MHEVLFAFLLTFFAGLSTGLGGIIALVFKRTNTKFLALCLSFSAGVMLYISFVEIFAKANESLGYVHGDERGLLFTSIAFFAGIGFIALIDKIIPRRVEEQNTMPTQSALTPKDQKALKRMGLMSALAIAIHNFPEGLVTFMAALQDPALGIPIAIAIAIHNVPEGIAISAPIYYATGSKKKALLFSFGSGLTEPLGAIVAYLLLARVLNESMFGVAFAAVGGIMVFIAVHQLLPVAQKYGEHRQVMKGLFAGMGVMALSLVIF